MVKYDDRRTNEEWLADLRGADQDGALADLRDTLTRGLRYALVKIMQNLDSFRGESRLTTWAQKIAVREALTELRRQRWNDIKIEDLMPEETSGDFTPAILTDPGASPETEAIRTSMMEVVQRLIMEELTDRQREAMLAVMVGGMPLEEVARRMDTNRNALYKLMHDARQRLQRRLAAAGLSPEEVLAAFD